MIDYLQKVMGYFENKGLTCAEAKLVLSLWESGSLKAKEHNYKGLEPRFIYRIGGTIYLKSERRQDLNKVLK